MDALTEQGMWQLYERDRTRPAEPMLVSTPVFQVVAQHLLEATAAYTRERTLARLRAGLAAKLRIAFRKQQGAFLSRLERLQPSTESLREAGVGDWQGAFDQAALETLSGFSGPLTEYIQTALIAGNQQALAAGAFDVSFELPFPEAANYASQRAAALVTSINETTRTEINRLVTKSVDEGQSYSQLAKALRDKYAEFHTPKPQLHIKDRAEGIAVHECVTGDTLVRAVDVSRAMRRWYVGRLMHITTASGNELSITPNHPILTPSGWVAAGELVEGDRIICGLGTEEMALGDPNIENPPTMIHQIFDSLLRDVPSNRTAGTHVDFHGDGMNSDVDVIALDGELSRGVKTSFGDPCSEHLFTSSDLSLIALATYGLCHLSPLGFSDALAHAREFTHAPSRGGMGIEETSAPLPKIEIRPVCLTGFGVIADMNSIANQDGSDPVIRDPIPLSQRLGGFAIDVRVDHISRIDILTEWSGHVYNLTTNSGRYMANGVIVHNCGDAYEQGNMDAASTLAGAGLEMQKSALTVGDSRVDPECQANQDAGWIPMDQPFPDGNIRAPFHVYCRCSTLYRQKPDASQETPA